MSVFYDLSKTPRKILNQAIVRAIVSENNGAWFDPSDLSTLYQDAAGTIPVTAVEQPVGLVLDKSQGLMLGPELITNGDFSNGATGWLTGIATGITGSTSSSGGTATIYVTGSTSNDADISLKQVCSIYRQVKITADVLSITGNLNVSLAIRTFNGSTYTFYVIPVSTSIGKISMVTPALPSGRYIDQVWFSVRTSMLGAAGSVVIDNISVRELYGNHATQSITASRPTLSARYNQLLNSATLSTQSVTTVAAQYTLSFTGTGSVTLSGTATGTLAGTGTNNRVSLSFTPTAGTLTLTVTGSVTLAMLAFGTLTTYQAITTATSYDSAGWNRYISFDGIDDHLNLPYMGLYANGSASVVCAIANSVTSPGFVAAEGNSANSNTRYGLVRQQNNAAGSYIVSDSGVLLYNQYAAQNRSNGITRVVSVVDAGTHILTSVNGSQVAFSYTRSAAVTTDSTTIGVLKSTTNIAFFNGNITGGLIITKSALSDTDRRRCEQFLASRLTTLGVALS